MPRMRVVLADDFAPFRESVIAAFPYLDVVGQASTGREAIALVARERPDAILLDFRMPEMDGAAAAARILETHPETAVLLASLSVERPYVFRSLAAGARAYIAKDDAIRALPEALKAVLAGTCYLSPLVTAALRLFAPPHHLAITQQVLRAFEREAPALLECARQAVDDSDRAKRAVLVAFQAYWTALREGQKIVDPQTWLLLSVVGLLLPGRGDAPKPWTWLRAHPSDRELAHSGEVGPRLLAHLESCNACHLARCLSQYTRHPEANVPDSLRAAFIGGLENPDETALFLSFAQRQAGVMRLAASELRVLLGVEADRSWARREASAGSWLAALLGAKPEGEAA